MSDTRPPSSPSFGGAAIEFVGGFGSVLLAAAALLVTYRISKRTAQHPRNFQWPKHEPPTEFTADVRRAYHELELDRLRTADEWQQRMRARAAKAAADYQERIKRKTAGARYSAWGTTPTNAEAHKHDFAADETHERSRRYQYAPPPPPPPSTSGAAMNLDKAKRLLDIGDAAMSEANVKAAFRRLALQLHPDMAAGNEDRFKAVAEAYDMIIHDIRRT